MDDQAYGSTYRGLAINRGLDLMGRLNSSECLMSLQKPVSSNKRFSNGLHPPCCTLYEDAKVGFIPSCEKQHKLTK